MIRWQRATLPLWLLSATGCFCQSDAASLCTPFPHFDTHDHVVCPIDATAPIRASKSLDFGWVKGDACHGFGRDQICTFTHPKFNRGLGIALITTDAILEDVSSWLPMQPFDAMAGGLAAVPPYEAKQIPGKGVGLIANRSISQGELIMARTPAVVVDGTAFKNLSTSRLTQALAHAIQSLPYDHQVEYLQLTTHDDATTYEERVYKIFAKNNFRTKFNKGKDFHSTFTEVSRLNHDCRPNTKYGFHAPTLSQKVFAAREISAGEELSIAYYDPVQIRTKRQQQLLSYWGFECTCEHCSADAGFVTESDGRIQQIHSLWSELDDYSRASSGSVEKAERLLELYRLERLDTRIHEAYYRAAIEWNGAGDSAAAVEAARRCLERGEQMRGVEAPFARNMRELIQDPKRHWSWRFRLPTSK